MWVIYTTHMHIYCHTQLTTCSVPHVYMLWFMICNDMICLAWCGAVSISYTYCNLNTTCCSPHAIFVWQCNHWMLVTQLPDAQSESAEWRRTSSNPATNHSQAPIKTNNWAWRTRCTGMGHICAWCSTCACCVSKQLQPPILQEAAFIIWLLWHNLMICACTEA